MSFLDIFMDPEHRRLNELESATSRLNASAQSDAQRMHALEQHIIHLTQVSAALWELLKRNSNLSDDDLKRAIAEVRASGTTLARNVPPGASPTEVYCPACSHRISPTVSRCIYCGAAVTPQVAEGA